MMKLQNIGGFDMTITKSVTDILNGSITAIKSVIPLQVNVKQPSLLKEPFDQKDMAVLIGMTGDVRGRIIIDAATESFQAIGSSMFGMPLEGDMLESFAGELGNMIAGNLSTKLSDLDYNMDITPPTVIVGNSKMYGLKDGLILPIQIETVGDLSIILVVEK